MKHLFFWRAIAALAAVATLFTVSLIASGHEGREVGEYRLTVGFLSEPAYEGEPNGVSVRVVKVGVGGAASTPVTGIEDKLQVEVTHVPSNSAKDMELHEAHRDPGLYVSNFIPTSPGVYRFRIRGEINGTRLDETFTSGPDAFDEVEAAREVQFPLQLGSSREIEAAVRGAQASSDGAQSTADTARRLAIVGMAVGAAGLAAGALGVAVAMRKR